MADFKKLIAKNVGPIKEADVRFGDLTVLVGPQASGKSIFLQLFRLIADSNHICATLRRYGMEWKDDVPQFLEVYLGEELSRVWTESSQLRMNGQLVNLRKMIFAKSTESQRKMFYIPAHRTFALPDGRFRPFESYQIRDPFAVRDFSDQLRLYVDGIARAEGSSLMAGADSGEVARTLDQSISKGFKLFYESLGPQKRLILKANSSEFPFMSWSSGQREAIPCWLALNALNYIFRRTRLMPKWVIIEEPEMGLHPRAISALMLKILQVLSLGYRICLSTHSAEVLDVVWALKVFQQHDSPPERLFDLFGVKPTDEMQELAKLVMTKKAFVYYFDVDSRTNTSTTQDISDLDPGSPDPIVAGWGELSGFSGHVGDVVADAVAEAQR